MPLLLKKANYIQDPDKVAFFLQRVRKVLLKSTEENLSEFLTELIQKVKENNCYSLPQEQAVTNIENYWEQSMDYPDENYPDDLPF